MTTAIREKPILFSSPMVAAILDDLKTMTRRVIKPQPYEVDCPASRGDNITPGLIRLRKTDPCLSTFADACPYGAPGDLLVPLCTWATEKRYDTIKPTALPSEVCAWTRWQGEPPSWRGKLRPGRFMPTRLRECLPRLEITAVRVERLQEITEEDAVEEGAQCPGVPASLTNRGAFAKLWDKLYGKKHPWASNPWLWVITFRRIEQ